MKTAIQAAKTTIESKNPAKRSVNSKYQMSLAH